MLSPPSYHIPSLPQAGIFAAAQSSLTLTSVLTAPHQVFMLDGRSAIYAALKLSGLKSGEVVLIPTYHCPTMVAPAVALGAQVRYFGINAQGAASLDDCDRHLSESRSKGERIRALLLSHYFGWPQTFITEVAKWCRLHQIILIEDCAHQPIGNIFPEKTKASYHSASGYEIKQSTVIGSIGDFAVSSLGKFFPTLHGGLLTSHHRPLDQLKLKPLPTSHNRAWQKSLFVNQAISGHTGIMSNLYRAQLRLRGKAIGKRYPKSDKAPSLAQLQAQFQLELADCAAPAWLRKACLAADAGQIAAVRQMRARQWLHKLDGLPACRPLMTEVPVHSAPYVFPVWVNNAQPVFEALRTAGVPVFRWDWLWPDTPKNKRDHGFLWSHHVLQLPCHQSISDEQFDYITTVFVNAIALSLDTLLR